MPNTTHPTLIAKSWGEFYNVYTSGTPIAFGLTETEANTVKRAVDTAFEVASTTTGRAQAGAAPRFTRDEAIAIVKEALPEPVDQACEHYLRGLRHALEALAAAGVFSDCGPECSPRLVCAKAMSDKLDAAGIR